MNRRDFVKQVGHLSIGATAIAAGVAQARSAPGSSMPSPVSLTSTSPHALIATWQCALRLSATGEAIAPAAPTHYVGLLQSDWENNRIHVRQTLAVSDRVHGLVASPEGGFYALAYRPGGWLMRVDRDGQVKSRVALGDEPGGRTLNGHAALNSDGRWLVTSETSVRDSEGWISVRDSQTLARVAQWRTRGYEPHDLRFLPDGSLLVANGGILRGAADSKRDLDRMDSSLVRMDVASGALLGQWRLPDRRLSLRHLAVSSDGGRVRVGVGLQAEHETATDRADAPILAVLDLDDRNGDASLRIPTRAASGKGYCGDITAGPAGGFYLASERAHRVFLWHPDRPADLLPIAELERASPLATWPPDDHGRGVLIGAARGLARWHPRLSPAMMRWPLPLAIDNHWVVATPSA